MRYFNASQRISKPSLRRGFSSADLKRYAIRQDYYHGVKEMITVMVNAKVKEEKLAEFIELASTLTRETRNRQGCISYSFNQRIDNPTDFVIYEQWETQSALDEHIQALTDLLGPAKEGELLPEKLLGMYEEAKATYYETLKS